MDGCLSKSQPTLGQFLVTTETLLDKANLVYGHGTDNAWDEAVAIARAVLGLALDADNSCLLRLLSPQECIQLETLRALRVSTQKPLPYLTHEVALANNVFYVDERVIVPRSPLAHILQSETLHWWLPDNVLRVLDLCTGSGCLAIIAAQQFAAARVDAVDLSADALAVATINIERHQCSDRISLIQSNLFSHVTGKYDLIISNPPYVAVKEELPLEYHYEPGIALYAGEDGLDCIKKILQDVGDYLNDHGIFIFEVGSAWQQLALTSALPFLWLDSPSGGEGLALLRKQDLLQGRQNNGDI